MVSFSMVGARTFLLVFVSMFVAQGWAQQTLASEPESSNTEPLKVVATIPPLAFMATDVLGAHANVRLISQQGSPHHRVLRPSDVMALEEADLILWVGPELEQYMVRFADKYQSKSLALLSNTPESTHIHNDDADHDGHGHDHHGHEHSVDPHLWLSPEAAKAFTQVLVQRLSSEAVNSESIMLSEVRAELDHNVVRFAESLDRSVVHWRQQMMPLLEKPYFVYHNAYAYLEQSLGLSHQAVLTVNPGVKPSARKLAKLARTLKGVEAACVFFEPEFQKVRLDRVTQATLHYQLLDPLASSLSLDQSNDHYVRFLTQLIDQFSRCVRQLP